MAICEFHWSTRISVHATLLLMRHLGLIVLRILMPFVGFAQCSMCKAVAESANGGGFGPGLNYGILYLMIFPYLIIGGIAYRLYRARKAN